MKIAAGVLAAVEAHARETAPHECCGLLLGTADGIIEFMRANNRAADPERRYEIDPHDHFAAVRCARTRGLDVIGAYHSHPRSAPVPSPTDEAQAFEDFVFLILGRAGGIGQPFAVRAWQFRGGNFAELALVSVP
jgi:proteasome lid subunit RPN8/RPN11